MEPISSGRHISPEVLEKFSRGTLSREESRTVSDHLALCTRCRAAFVETMNSIDVTETHPLDRSDGSTPSISGYRDMRPLAQGGMGSVYLAYDEKTGQKVAIKVIKPRPHDAFNSDRKERLVREARALTKLDHPNIVRAIEVLLIDESPALVMEYVQGQTLHRWIRNGLPDHRLVAQLVLDLARAIAHAHRNGVVHCDLKPHNVLVIAQNGLPSLKVIDFGLAKLSDERWDITCSGDILGTPAYMAPEQTLGKPIPANPTIDVYGLGTILYELLTGQAPFEASTSTMLLTKVARDTPQRPRKIHSETPTALERICMKCLEKMPQDRYATPELLANDLQAYLVDRPISAREPSTVRKIVRRVKSNGWLTLAMLITGVLLTLGGLAWWNERQTTANLTASMQRATTQQQQATSRAEQAEEAVLEELRTSFEETSERLFGSTPDKEDAQWEALDRIYQRWERFADRVDSSDASRLVRGEALMRLGSIHTLLAELSPAEQKLNEALDVLQGITGVSQKNQHRLVLLAESHWELAKCLFDAGRTQESQKAFQEALAISTQANRSLPNDTKQALLTSKIQRDYGVMLTRTNQFESANKNLSDSIEILKVTQARPQDSKSSDASSQRRIIEQLWSSKTAKAMALRMQGGSEQAIQLLDESSPQLMDLQTQMPEDPILLRLLSVHQFTRSLCQRDLGRLGECKESLLKALEYQKTLVGMYPTRHDLLQKYGSLCGELGIVSIRLNQPNEALDSTFEALQIQSQLAIKYPDRPEYLGEKAKSLINLVAILGSLNRLQEAITHGSELIEIQTRLSLEHPEQADYAYGLAASLNIFATVHGRLGENVLAYDYFDQSYSIYTELIERNPSVKTYRAGFANSCFSKAELALRSSDLHLAIDAYSQAIEIIYLMRPFGLLAESKLLASAYLGQASAYQALGNHAASRVCAQLGADTIETCKDADLQCQEILRRCLELAVSKVDGASG
ncbi:MAG: protein kinase domain-containing protein [Planctomycetota bacterium]